MDDLRKEFEKFLVRADNLDSEELAVVLKQAENGRYAQPTVNWGFEGFRAGHALAMKQQAKRIAELEADCATLMVGWDSAHAQALENGGKANRLEAENQALREHDKRAGVVDEGEKP